MTYRLALRTRTDTVRPSRSAHENPPMNQKDFLDKLEDERIVAAIAAAEKKSSGQIRVYISQRNIADALEAAREQFQKLGMTHTKDRNGVLLYFAPESRNFAVVGDEGVHARCGEAFWNSTVAEIAEHLKADRLTEAVVHAIEKVGGLLAEHFPRRADDQNELPDRVERGL